MQSEKVSILVVDKNEDRAGVIANCAFVLALTAGRELPHSAFGSDVVDGDGDTHRYLTKISHFVRKANQTRIRALREEFAKNPDVLIVDYPEVAATASYSEYESSVAHLKGEEIHYRAVYLYGSFVELVPKTKNLSAL